ncbi:hypothetical protein MYAM1_001541 [Malassezia yamatoensis]|uniref:DUF1214 domain-containing protein n=1 Tax=Malassezia yamatoensis TaxID=253288 RepID=A0AAJ5YQU1_9BASI|nr:hypothetical protein MYAM1_001541 [Malassezia yamatoensis]
MLWFSELLALCFAGIVTANPLATQDQRKLDQRALTIFHAEDFHKERSAARAQWEKTLKKYHVPITEQVSSDLNTMINELVFSSIQKAVNGDPSDPHVYWVDTAARTHDWFGLKVEGGRYSYDNPDCIYRLIPISAKYSYRIHGRRYGKGVADASFSLISNPNSQQTVHALYDKDLHVNNDGSYTITINASDTKSRNHIPSSWQVKQAFIRHNLGDWSSETPDDLKVEIVDGPKHSKPYTNKEIIASAKKNLGESTFFYGFGALDLKTYSEPLNHPKTPQQSQSLGTLTSQAQSFAPFQLKDNQTLVVTLTKGEASYFVFPIYTEGMITTDPSRNQVSLNSVQSFQNHNGSYTYVVSRRDPGVYNWLDTAGRDSGTTMIRWQGLATSGNAAKGIEVYSQVVPFDHLSKVLPKETKKVSTAQRKQLLEDRAANYHRIHYQ